jgi:hypothetical protein
VTPDTPRTHAFHAAHARAVDRVRYCEANVARYTSSYDAADPYQCRHLRKLQIDLSKAMADAKWFEGQLDQAMRVAGLAD